MPRSRHAAYDFGDDADRQLTGPGAGVPQPLLGSIDSSQVRNEHISVDENRSTRSAGAEYQRLSEEVDLAVHRQRWF
jgi:hypothetical protein